MARTTEHERLRAIERLRACFERFTCKRVIDGHGHIDLNAPKRIDHVFKAIEIDLSIVMDRHTRQLGNRLDRKRRTAECISCVDLLLTIARQFDHCVTIDRNHGYLGVARIDARKNHGVSTISTAVNIALFALFRFINADQKHVERFTGRIGCGERSEQIIIEAVLQIAVDIGNEGKRNANACKYDHQEDRSNRHADLAFMMLLLLARGISILSNITMPRIGAHIIGRCKRFLVI